MSSDQWSQATGNDSYFESVPAGILSAEQHEAAVRNLMVDNPGRAISSRNSDGSGNPTWRHDRQFATQGTDLTIACSSSLIENLILICDGKHISKTVPSQKAHEAVLRWRAVLKFVDEQ